MAKTNKPQPQDETAPEVPPAPQSAGDTTAGAPERDRIAARAYEIYLERGGTDGADMEDWLAAEREFGTTDRPTDE